MASQYSKFLNEIIIEEGVNDEFKIEEMVDGTNHTITVAEGRYRDIIALTGAISTLLNAESYGEYSSATMVTSDTGTVSVVMDSGQSGVNLLFYSSSSNALRDILGYSGANVGYTLSGGADRVVATSQHWGGFYPSEPVEMDDRPKPTGTDRWNPDTFQTMGRTGMVATKGGTVPLYFRSCQFLLDHDDLETFQTWMAICAQGYSFAYYHDRTEAWDGPDDEYEEYKLDLSGEQKGYDPERVEPANNVWHRQHISMIKRVAATS